MEIIQERLEREYDLDLLATAPSVEYEVAHARRQADRDRQSLRSAVARRDRRDSRTVDATSPSSSPSRYIGNIMELVTGRRGIYQEMIYLDEDRVQLKFDMPLGELIVDFYDQLKSRTQGYASLDYNFAGLACRPIWSSSMCWSTARRSMRSRSSRHRDDAYYQGPRTGASAAQADSAPDVRCADPGIDRQPDHRPRNDPRHAQERASPSATAATSPASANCSKSKKKARRG